MAACPGENGAMADIAADEPTVRELIASLPVEVAGFNAPEHLVVSGPGAAVATAVERTRARGLRATPLPVSHAFHSPLVAPAAVELDAFLATLPFDRLDGRVVSTVTGDALPPDADLRELLLRQLTSPVLFTQALRAAAAEVDLLVEVGPGRILRDLAPASVEVPVVSTDAGGPSLGPFLGAVGAAFALGAPVVLDALAAERVARPDPLRPRSFLANPCELAPDVAAGAFAEAAASNGDVEEPPERSEVPSGGDALGTVRGVVARFAELPLDAIEPGSRLLTDLNLNSITIAEIASEAAAELGVSPPVAPTELADASVADLAQTLAEQDERVQEEAAPAGVESWLRPFALEWQAEERPQRPAARCGWSVFGPESHPLLEPVRSVFAAGDGEPAAVVCAPAARTPEAARELLQALQAAARDAARVLVLHDGGGAGGIAKTLALERPDLVVCLADVPPDATHELLAAAREEAERARSFTEVRLQPDGTRLVPRLRMLEPEPRRSPLGPEDVLLATGGGKGIGAECAFALAVDTGAALAVLGRSDATADGELRQSLERLESSGVRFRYVRADVGDAEAVRAAVDEIRRTLGPVTAVLHAAGTNTPRLLEDLDPDALAKTIEPKVTGLANVLDAVDGSRLRLLVAFGSIIASAGMRGEADYALANEWLRLAVSDAAVELPACRCLTIEWSVWSGVGMGERLGRIQSLLRAGVTPIDPDEGVDLFRRLVSARALPTSLVATGRFAHPPTLPLEEGDLPVLRFLERPVELYPRVELVAESTVSVATDPYLADHQLGGVPLLPAVFGLEAMAQAAAAAGGREVRGFADVELLRPITVPPDGRRTLRVAALARDASRVDVVLRSDQTGFDADHFRATCLFEPPEVSTPGAPSSQESVELEQELYGRLLFHGPSFRRVRRYRELRARRCVAEVGVAQDARWFSAYLPQTLVLGDPGARDAFIHAAQACIPHRRVLPLSIERVALLRRPQGPVTVVAVERESTADTLVYDLTVFDASGRACEAWQGLTLRAVEPLAPPEAWRPELFVPYLERRLGELLPGAPVSVALEAAEPNGGRTERTDAAVARALGRSVRVLHRADGKPEASSGAAVSVAHDTVYTLALAGAAPVACDIEPVVAREPERWRDLLGPERLRLAELLARETGEELELTATRLWVASECVRKAGRSVAEPIVLDTAADEGWALLRAGRLRIATVVAGLRGLARPVVVGVLSSGEPA
jgi:enediyne polyketide synthase